MNKCISIYSNLNNDSYIKNNYLLKNILEEKIDPNNIANETFVGEIISDGTVSKDFANTIPPKFGKVVNANDKAQRGTEAIGPSNPKGKVFQI